MSSVRRKQRDESEKRSESHHQRLSESEDENERDRHEQAFLSEKGMPVLWMAGKREYHLERTSE